MILIDRLYTFIISIFSTKRSALLMMAVVPLFFGLLSVFYGQPSGWDFFNYHVYNGYAFVHGRLDLDLAPAGFQSYFNPLLDSAYYLMSVNLPPKLVGFIMGFVPALVFIPLWLSIRLVLSNCKLTSFDFFALTTVLALCGLFSASFIGRNGSVDGDAITTIFQISSLYVVLRYVVNVRIWSLSLLAALLIAGFFSGLGSGLKLTGVTASLALCLGLLFIKNPLIFRFRLAFVFGLGVLFGLSATGGWWFIQMYQHFGNPLFPQFSSFFPNALTPPLTVIDKRFLPSGFLDLIFRPFYFLFNPGNFDGIYWPQIIWPILYLTGVFFLVKKFLFLKGDAAPLLSGYSVFVISYTLLGFVFWLFLFGIYRYQLYFYLTAPMVIFVFLKYVFGEAKGAKAMLIICLVSFVMALVFGVASYKAEPWSDRFIQPSPADAFTVPNDSTVLLDGQPLAWIAPFFPPTAALVGIGGTFPFSAGYLARVKTLIERNEHTFVVFELPQNYREISLARINQSLTAIGLNRQVGFCDVLEWTVSHTRIHAAYQNLGATDEGPLCKLTVLPADRQKHLTDVIATNQRARSNLLAYGYDLDQASCSVRNAYVGQRLFSFELCELR